MLSPQIRVSYEVDIAWYQENALWPHTNGRVWHFTADINDLPLHLRFAFAQLQEKNSREIIQGHLPVLAEPTDNPEVIFDAWKTFVAQGHPNSIQSAAPHTVLSQEAWIETYGSKELREGYRLNYPVQAAYVQERAAQELGRTFEVVETLPELVDPSQAPSTQQEQAAILAANPNIAAQEAKVYLTKSGDVLVTPYYELHIQSLPSKA